MATVTSVTQPTGRLVEISRRATAQRVIQLIGVGTLGRGPFNAGPRNLSPSITAGHSQLPAGDHDKYLAALRWASSSI